MKNIFAAKFAGNRAQVGRLSFQNKCSSSSHGRIAIRPEHVKLSVTAPEGRQGNRLEGTISRIRNHGVYSDLAVDASGVQFQSILTTSSVCALNLAPGRHVFVSVAPEDIHLL